MANRQAPSNQENLNLNPKALTVSELVHGRHYYCLLSTRKVIFIKTKILWLFSINRAVWYDETDNKYKRTRVVDNQLRGISQIDKF